MSTNRHAFEHALRTSDGWVRSVAQEFGTDDLAFVQRAVRAWLHGLRDELTVDACARFAAQLPELLRGVYYEGWDPSRVPVEHDLDAYVTRFAREAQVRPTEVRHVAAVVAAGLRRNLSARQLAVAFEQLPAPLRELLWIAPAANGEAPAAAPDDRLAQLERDVAALREAVRELAHGLEPAPVGERPGDDAARAARRAHQILLAASG